MTQETKISAGSYDLNKFLFGGWEKDIVTCIYGPAGSGKTNLCMLAVVSQAKKGNKVIFIDTEGGFSIERFKQLAGEDYEKYLENIILLKPTDFSEQQKAFSQLLKSLNNAGLIVIDGMTMLYRLELGDAIQDKDDYKIRDVNRELARQLRILAEIARNRNIPVLITNQVYSEFQDYKDFQAGKEKTIKMVGGDLLKYWSKCLVELKLEKGRRKLVLIKHRSIGEKELEFVIVNDGIRKRGLF